MTVRLEHANLSVHDIDAMIRFLRAAFPEFRIRRDATEADGLRWVHLGTDDTYIALNQVKVPRGMTHKGTPLNHLAYEVPTSKCWAVDSARRDTNKTRWCPTRIGTESACTSTIPRGTNGSSSSTCPTTRRSEMITSYQIGSTIRSRTGNICGLTSRSTRTPRRRRLRAVRSAPVSFVR